MLHGVGIAPLGVGWLERLLSVVNEESKEEIVTAAEQLIERGRREERREVPLEQLRSRFGTLPDSAATRVRTADPAQLKRWLVRVLTASTVAEVLTEE